MDTKRIQQRLREFTKDRDWDQFHNPKNLVMALAGETGELVELFQWLSFEEAEKAKLDGDLKRSTSEELADIQIYLLRLADKLEIDLEAAVDSKITEAESKYPVEKAKGTHTKYKDL